MGHINRRCAFAVKLEGTAGTAETVSFTDDAVRLIGASEPEILPLAPNERDDFVTGSVIIPAGATPAGFFIRARLRWAPIGAGATYSASVKPEDHVLRQIGGFTATVDTSSGTEKWTYTPTGDPTSTGTFKLQISGKEYTGKGAVLESMSTSVDANGFPVCEATIIGVYVTETETALSSATYDSVPHPIFKGASSLVIASYSPVAQHFSLDEGLQAEPNVDANAADGLLFYKIVRHKQVATVRARIPALATWNPRADWIAKTVTALDAHIGVAQGQFKRIKFDADAGTYVDVQDVADGNFRNYTAQIHCGPHASAPGNWIFD